jgi:hypothetical protein
MTLLFLRFTDIYDLLWHNYCMGAGKRKTNFRKNSKKRFNTDFVKAKNRWRADYDYIKDLSHEEAMWLSKFTKEYYDGDMKEWAGHKKPINNTAQLRRECWDNNSSKSVRFDAVVLPDFFEETLCEDSYKRKFSPEQQKIIDAIDAVSAAVNPVSLVGPERGGPKRRRR